jgi:hypothetical protein
METVRDTWTDERLDDFRGEMAEFRHEVKDEFGSVRQGMKELQKEMNLRFDSLQRSMVEFGGLMIAALIGLIATQA